MKKRTIGLMGSTQTEHVSKVLEGKYDVILEPSWTGHRIIDAFKLWRFMRKVDLIYIVFVSASTTRYALAKHMGKKVFLHWIGTDAYQALGNPSNYMGTQKYVDCQVSCFEPISDELRTVGIETDVIPIVPFNIDLTLANTPSEHSVLVYLPERRKEWYGYSTIKEVAERMPNLTFTIVANDNKDLFSTPNVKMLGTLTHNEMNKLYDEVSIVLRFITHDGYAMSIIEGLAKGKDVVWNYPHPYSHHAVNADEIIDALSAITATPPRTNLEGADYINKHLNLDVIRKLTYEKIDELFVS